MSRIPVIIGVGEFLDRPGDAGAGLEPLELLIRAAQSAEQDAGVRCLRRIDTVRVVSQISWPYRDLAGLLTRRLRLRAAESIYGPVGGESPLRLLLEAAVEIACGESQVALLCGAEALKSAMFHAARGETPGWSDEDPLQKLPAAEDYVTAHAARYGLIKPVDVYPLYENATRAAWGQSIETAQRESGEIWSDMSRTAAANPCAWSGKPLSAEEIITPSGKNRPIAYPYPKFLVAQLGVNQAAAILLTHLEAARDMGVPQDRIVYVGSGAGAHEPYDFLARERYDLVPAMSASLQQTLELNGITTADLDLYELYSCFPCVPKLARRALGLSATTTLSVTGGLTFFGGPGNNYMTHAVAAMVRALRAGRGHRGLLYGNGEFLTKHHALVLADAPPATPLRNVDLQEGVEAQRGEPPRLLEHYEGPCSIETYTVSYGPRSEPDRGAVIARTRSGERVVCRVTAADVETLSALVSGEEIIGRAATVYDGRDGLLHLTLGQPAPLPEPPLLYEIIDEHIALVTLNRPRRRNAIDGAVTRLMADYLRRVEDDPRVRVAVLAASGDTFCGGADLTEVAAGHADDMVHSINGFAGFVNARRGKPWIAAVRGSAVGGGTELALACDLIVAGENSAFGLPEVARGLVAAAGGAYRLPRVMAPRRAMEMLLTGAPMSATEAAGAQLVNRVTADAEVMRAALELARRIAANAPLAVARCRRLAAAALDWPDIQLSKLSLQAITALMSGEDAKEGVRAFLEKRAPVWKGH